MESVFYLGASTPKGFVSHFDSLFREVRQLTIIKGGPGCGKSTFMRTIVWMYPIFSVLPIPIRSTVLSCRSFPLPMWTEPLRMCWNRSFAAEA